MSSKSMFDREHLSSKNARQKRMPSNSNFTQNFLYKFPLQFLYFRCIDGQLNQFMPTQVKSVKLTLKIRQRSNCRKNRQIEEKIRQMQIKQTSS